MRQIHTGEIADAIEKLCMDANYNLNDDISEALRNALQAEESGTGKSVLGQLIENAELARACSMAICQDTGMAVVFADIGQDVHITGGSFRDAVNEGVRRGYSKGFLRNSVVRDPIDRVNTGDNTPAIIHFELVEGDRIKLVVAPKGFGSENMSAVRMLKPSDGLEGVKAFILDTVDKAGPNPCPPVILGVGIGGTMEKAAMLSKRALLRPVNIKNSIGYVRSLEEEMLMKINSLGIGPAGLGGRFTALAVNIEVYPTHIAGLPVAINMGCHATRHSEVVL